MVFAMRVIRLIGPLAVTVATLPWMLAPVALVQSTSAHAAPAEPNAKKDCQNCGTVDAIVPITRKGEASGVGAIAGGVIGGVLGHQVGGGRGKDLATVAGAAGGAYAGHQAEKNMKSVTEYQVAVKLDDGTTRKITFKATPGFKVGDRVSFNSNGKMSRL